MVETYTAQIHRRQSYRIKALLMSNVKGNQRKS